MISVLAANDVHVSGSFDGRTFVSVYAGRARTADILAHRTALEGFIAERRTSVPVLTVVGHGSTLGDRGRRAISRMLSDLDEDIKAWAVVMEGGGSLWLPAARLVASGVRLVSGSSCPFKLFAGTAEATRWLAENTGERYPSELGDALKAIEHRLRERGPSPA